MKNQNEQITILATEILNDLEQNEVNLSSIALKCLKLARLSGDQYSLNLFKFELSGYPKDENGFILPDAFRLASAANRVSSDKDKQTGKIQESMFVESPDELLRALETAKKLLEHPATTVFQRNFLPRHISDVSKKIEKLRAGYYGYVLEIYYKYVYGNISEEIFNRMRKKVDENLLQICPDAIKKFITAYQNLLTKDEENWANAVHSCRRILLDFADSLFPPSEEKVKTRNGFIKLDKDHYVLRLKEYIKSKSKSDISKEVIGSTLEHIGNRIDSVYNASTKGTHAKVTKEEAERYVIYTYLLIGDILIIN